MTLPEPVPSEEGTNRPSLIVIGLGVLLLLNFGAIGYFLGQRGDSETTTANQAPSTSVETEDPDDELATDAVEDTTTTTAETTTTTSTSLAETTTTEALADDLADGNDAETDAPEPETAEPSDTADVDEPDSTGADSADAPSVDVDEDGEAVRNAVLRGGVLYLSGSVPSVEIEEAIVGKAVAVMGEDRVVNNYEIDPDAPIPDGGEIYVEDLVLFPYGSTELNPAFAPLLDLGTLLLLQNPQATLTVIAHTDADGPAAYNLELSQQRADQVAAYWIAAGADPGQVIAIGRGEEEPIADSTTPEGAQANRRAEFIVTGLLD